MNATPACLPTVKHDPSPIPRKPVARREPSVASGTAVDSGRSALRHATGGRSQVRSTHRLRRWSGCAGLVLFAGNAAFGQVAVEVELVPDKPGPYYAGQHITVDVWLHSQLPDDYVLPYLQFDFADTDPSLILEAQFVFDFSSVPEQPTAYEGWTFPDLPVPWTANTLGCFCPGEFIRLPAMGLRHIGNVGVTIPPESESGSFTLDVLNRTSPSPTIGSNGAMLYAGAACVECPSAGQLTAFDGEISGGAITLISIGAIPAVSTWGVVLLALALPCLGTLLLRRRPAPPPRFVMITKYPVRESRD